MKRRKWLRISLFVLLSYFAIRVIMISSSLDYLFFYKENLYQFLAWLDFLLLVPFLVVSSLLLGERTMIQLFLFLSFFPFIGLIFFSVFSQSLEYGDLSVIENDDRYILGISGGFQEDPDNRYENRIFEAKLYEKKFSFIYKRIHSSRESISNTDNNSLSENKIKPIYLKNKGLIKFGNTVLHIKKKGK
ncbi:hypothetical protein [Pseudobacillus wudalianchiensis]|uniref:Uncharacterized protein n=1 Tax=Pseudobacillus wudalianchiensis TaxID=1743143 RepID=A0A1B9B922_9BACI|nr:hypothetical protein [Bacillus wudalianchiensis]OCA92580.1 hypothetical protein A8F95_02470 [Bacillus wudalianchiensis]